MSNPTETTPLDAAIIVRPHVIACTYDSVSASKNAFEALQAIHPVKSGVMRLQVIGGGQTVAVCADDQAAAFYSARLPWGPGTPTPLSNDVCLALTARRKAATQRGAGRFVRRKQAQVVRRPRNINERVTQLPALNTSREPWPAAGGICGAVCDSFSTAAELRAIIVAGHLDRFEGLIAAFDEDDRGIVAAVADTADSSRLTTELLLELAGNLEYQPDPTAAWFLWALRIHAGLGPFPISVDGDPEAVRNFLTGKPSTTRVRTHAPTRNQACPCGSGIKYKRCCGR